MRWGDLGGQDRIGFKRAFLHHVNCVLYCVPTPQSQVILEELLKVLVTRQERPVTP